MASQSDKDIFAPANQDQEISLESGQPDQATSAGDKKNSAVDPEEKGLSASEAQNVSEPTTTQSEKPYSAFSTPQKWFIVAMASAASFFSPLSGQIYYPVLPILTKNYDLTPSMLNISVTTYMIFQGLAPSFMGTFSDAGGRRPAYILAFSIYTGANIGLALQNSYAALLVLRCVQSAGSSGAVSFGYGVVADIITTAERGTFMGPMAAGAMMGPALGPVIGGLLAQFLGWRSVFWFLVIISGSFLAIFITFQPETHRNIVDDGTLPPSETWRKSLLQITTSKRRQNQERKTQRQRAKIGLPNPLHSFKILLQLDALMLITYTGLMMFGNLVLMTATPTLYPGIYGLNELEVGLCYLPLGVSATIAAVLNGKMLDRSYRGMAAKHGLDVDRRRGQDLTKFPIEWARLRLVFIWASVQGALFLPYGWALQYKAHLAVPLVIQFLLGFCLVCTSNSLSTLLADIFPGQVTTASAAQNLLRCLLGAVGSAVVDPMLKGMGTGWCFTFTGLMLLASLSLLWAEVKWGMGWRQKRWSRQEHAGGR